MSRDWDGTEPARAREMRAARDACAPRRRPTPGARSPSRAAGDVAEGLKGLSLIDAADPAEEAPSSRSPCARRSRRPARTAALVTPDRALARRVASELRRWDIDIDDSAGTPLAHTPPGTFLCLLAEAADAEFAPVPLLALAEASARDDGRRGGVPRQRAQARHRACAGRVPIPASTASARRASSTLVATPVRR